LSRMPDVVQNSVSVTDDTLLAKAEYIARIAESKYVSGEMVPADQAIPVYLRDTVTWKKRPGRWPFIWSFLNVALMLQEAVKVFVQ